MVQLPNDVVSKGYKEVRPYNFKQVFYSKKYDFTGTEEEFIKKGYAYRYAQLDKHRRVVIK